MQTLFFIILLLFTTKSYCLQFVDENHVPDNTYKLIGKKTGVEISKANPEDITPENYPTLVEKINHQNVALKDILDSISKALNINIIMAAGVDVSKKISIVSHSPITVAEVYQAFLSALALHDMTMIRSGSFFKVINRQKAVKSNVKVYTGNQKVNVDQFLTRVMKLKYIDAQSLETKMKPFIASSAESPANVLFYAPTNTVVISDYSLNVEKLRKIIESLDVPTTEDIIFKVFPVEFAQASNLVKILDKLRSGIMRDKQKKRYRPNYKYGGGSRSNTQSKSSDTDTGQEVNIIAIADYERTNSIIVTGNESGINKIEELIKQLDTKKKTGGGIHVYKVKHSTATELANTINAVIGNATRSSSSSGTKTTQANIPQVKAAGNVYQTAKSTGTAQSFKDIRIIPEENTNSLIVVSNDINYVTIKALLDKVDISRNQVFVKAIIMEINAERANDWKIANYYLPQDAGGVSRIGYGLSSLGEMAAEKEGATLLFPLSLFLDIPGIGTEKGNSVKGVTNMKNLFQLTKPGANLPDIINLPTLSSFVTFLQKTVGANVLSTPQVIALDHKEAKVSIIDEIPQVAESVTPTVGLSNINQVTSTKSIKVETELKFTPHINPSVNSIRMEITQKVDNVIKSTNVPSALQSTNLAVRKREITTSITLKDRETAVLGGLVKESNSKTNAKIPLLGDLPLIGWLFKNSKIDRKKSNLIVFITPHIIHSAEEHKDILSSKLEERMKFIRNFTGNEDPYKELTQEMLSSSGLSDEQFNEEQSSTYLENTRPEDTQYGEQNQESEVSESTEESQDNYYNDDTTSTETDDDIEEGTSESSTEEEDSGMDSTSESNTEEEIKPLEEEDPITEESAEIMPLKEDTTTEELEYTEDPIIDSTQPAL